MKNAVIAVALLIAGCVMAPPVRRSNAVQNIDPGQRDRAFSRALGAVQARGWIVAVSDRAAGLLTTQTMNAGVEPCGLFRCPSRQTLQVTITETGAVTVNIMEELFFSGFDSRNTRWFIPSDAANVYRVELEQARLLQEITGQPVPMPAAPVPPPEMSPVSEGSGM